MKKFSVLFSALLFVFSISVCADNYVKIGLKYNKTVVDSCSVISDGGVLNVNVGSINLIAGTEVNVNLKYNNGIEIWNSDNSAVHYIMNSPGEVIEIGSTSGIVKFNNISYRGTLMLTCANNGIQVVNYVEIEEYLKGVVPSEMPGSWNIEALKAQAICARNYTVLNKNRYKSYGFDLDDTTACQCYKGVSVEYPNSTLAVEQTRGQLLYYNGSVASLFYYSSSGGYTEDVKNVWGSSGYPYLVSLSDPYDPCTTWTASFSQEQLKARLSSLGINVGDVTSIEVTKRSPSDRAIETVVSGTEGTYTAELEKTRDIFGLKSSMYNVSSVMGKSGFSDVNVITASGYEKRVVTVPIITSNGVIEPQKSTIPSEFTFYGKGNGHGIGMSQYGAKGFADNGYTYDKILTYYFPGTTLEK